MNRSPVDHCRSNRVAGSATSGSPERRNRATTVLPVGVYKRDEEATRLGRARREREAEHAALAAAADAAAQIEKRRREESPALNHADHSRPLDDELNAGVGGILDERDRLRQARDVGLTAKLRRT